MGEVVIILLIVIMSLFVVLYMGSKIINRHPSYFHIRFGIKGFEISCSFFDNYNNGSQENQD